MKKNKQYDVFISYRRKGGEGIARALYDRLVRRGCRVAYDREALAAGRFDGQLLRMISNCTDVVVVLDADAFKEAFPPDSMFRQEIAHALRSECNVIPLMMDGFKFPKDQSELPEDIRGIAMHNGLGADMEYFDSAIGKLLRLMKSKPVGWFRRRLPWIVGLAVLAVAAIVTYAWTTPGAVPYPISAAEKQKFSTLVGDVMHRTTLYNSLMSAQKNMLRDSASGDIGAYDSSAAGFLNTVRDLKKQFDQGLPVSELTRLAEGSPVDGGQLQSLLATMRGEFENEREWVESLNPDSTLNKRDRAHYLDGQKAILETSCEVISCQLMILFRKVQPSALKEFKEAAQAWTMLPQLSSPWLRDDEELDRRLIFLSQKLNDAVNDLRTVFGNQSTSLTRDYDAMRLWLIAQGVPPDDAERRVEKIRKLDGMQLKLKQANDELAEKRRENSHAKPTDTTPLLLGKTLRFIGEGKYDEAEKAVTILKKRTSYEGGKSPNDYPPKALATLERVAQIRGKAPFTGGVLVLGYEPPATDHITFKVGDVITAINGERCATFADYSAKAGSGKIYTIYRLNDKGDFVKHDSSVPPEPKQPRVRLVGFGK